MTHPTSPTQPVPPGREVTPSPEPRPLDPEITPMPDLLPDDPDRDGVTQPVGKA